MVPVAALKIILNVVKPALAIDSIAGLVEGIRNMNTEIAVSNSVLPVFFDRLNSGLNTAASFISVGFATDVAKAIEGSIEAAINRVSPKISNALMNVAASFTVGNIVSEVKSVFKTIETAGDKFKAKIKESDDLIKEGVDAAKALSEELQGAASNELTESLDAALEAAKGLSKEIGNDDNAKKFANSMKDVQGAIEVAVGSVKDLDNKISDEKGAKVLAKAMKDVNVNIEVSAKSAKDLTTSIDSDKAVALKDETNAVNTAMTKASAAAKELATEIDRSAQNSDALKNITTDMHKLIITETGGVKEIAEAFKASAEAARQINLPLEQAYEITKNVYQTMSNMGSSTKDLGREMTALFGGRINTGKTQLADLLGVSQKMLKTWQANGTLFDQLKLRLDAFVSGSTISFSNAFSFVASKIKSNLNMTSIFDNAKTKLASFLVDLNKMDVGPGIKNITDAFNTIFSSLSGKTTGGLGSVFSDMSDYAIASIKKLNDYIGTVDVKGFLTKAVKAVSDTISFISAGVSKIWDALKATFTGLKLDQYFKLALPVVKALWDGVLKIGGAILDVATAIIPKFVSALSSKTLNLADGLNLNTITVSIRKVVDFIVERINRIKVIFDKVFPIVLKYINEWTPAIKEFLNEILKHLPTLVDMAIAYLKVKFAIDGIKNAVTKILPEIIAVGTKILTWAAMAKLAVEVFNVMVPVVKMIWDAFVGVYDAIKPIIAVIHKWNTAIMQLPFKLIMSLVNVLTGDFDRAGQYMTQWNVTLGGTWVLIKDILGVVWDIAKFFRQLSLSPMLGVLNAIVNLFEQLLSAVKLAGQALKDALLDGTNLALGFSYVKIRLLELKKIILQLPVINKLVDSQAINEIDQAIAAEKKLFSATVDIENNANKTKEAQKAVAAAVKGTADELRDANGKFIEVAKSTDIFNELTGDAADRQKELKTKLGELKKELGDVQSMLKQQQAWKELEINLKYVGTPTGGEKEKKMLKELEAEHKRVYKAMAVEEKKYTDAVKAEVMDANTTYQDEIDSRLEIIKKVVAEIADASKRKTAEVFTAMQARINSEQKYINMAKAGQEQLLRTYLDVMKERLNGHQENINKMLEADKKYEADIKSMTVSIADAEREKDKIAEIGMNDSDKARANQIAADKAASEARKALVEGDIQNAQHYAGVAKGIYTELASMDKDNKDLHISNAQESQQIIIDAKKKELEVTEQIKKENKKKYKEELTALELLKKEIQDVANVFTSIPKEQKAKIIFEQTGLDDIDKALKNIMSHDGKKIRITVQYDEQGKPTFSTHHEGGLIYPRARAFADGGTVPGAGDTDTVPAMLTPGEFVINKKAVAKIGVPLLDAINNMRLPDKIFSVFSAMKITPYNSGGLVAPSPFNLAPATGGNSGDMMTLNLQLGDTVVKTLTDKTNKGVLQQLVKEIEQQKRRGYQ